MQIERTWDSDLHIVQRFPQPAFRIAPATFVDRHLMPRRVRQACGGVWGLEQLPAHDIVVRRYDDVFIAGQGLVIRPLDRAVYQASISQHTEYDLEVGVTAVDQAERDGSVLDVEEPCVVCTKPGGDNYGHWLNEMLPRARYGRDLGLANMMYIVPAADPALAAVIRDSLLLLGIAERAILATAAPIRARRAYGVYGLTQHGCFMSPRVLDVVDEIAARVPAARSRKLYVTRGDRHRRFADEQGVCQRMSALGYQVVDPAALDFRQQISLFKSATEVVGAMGAAMTNIAFAPTQTPVTVFGPASMSDNFYWFLAGIRGQPYREVRCASAPERKGRGRWDHDLAVSPDEVARLVLSPNRPAGAIVSHAA